MFTVANPEQKHKESALSNPRKDDAIVGNISKKERALTCKLRLVRAWLDEYIHFVPIWEAPHESDADGQTFVVVIVLDVLL